MDAHNILNITANGIPFTVRLVCKGDTYGLNNAIEHSGEMPLVEFYDARFPHTQFGQFISRYYADTLTIQHGPDALDLHGGEPDWTIDAAGMQEVFTWLKLKEL